MQVLGKVEVVKGEVERAGAIEMEGVVEEGLVEGERVGEEQKGSD